MKQYNNGIWLTRRGDQIIPNFHSRQNQWKKEVIKVKKEDNQPLDKKEIIHQWEIYQSIADFFDKTKRMILMNYFPLFINSLWNPKLKETESFTSLLNFLFKMEDRMTEQWFAITPVLSRNNKELNFKVLNEQASVLVQKIKILNLN